MTTQTEQVLKEILGLSPIERAEMVEVILSSFDDPNQKGNDAAWAKEAEDRIDAYERGEIKTTPANQVFEKIDRKYTPCYGKG
jgi:putative addiction module component (TIGR02574 family)